MLKAFGIECLGTLMDHLKSLPDHLNSLLRMSAGTPSFLYHVALTADVLMSLKSYFFNNYFMKGLPSSNFMPLPFTHGYFRSLWRYDSDGMPEGMHSSSHIAGSC